MSIANGFVTVGPPPYLLDPLLVSHRSADMSTDSGFPLFPALPGPFLGGPA